MDQMKDNIGQALAQRITAAFTSHEFKDVITREGSKDHRTGEEVGR